MKLLLHTCCGPCFLGVWQELGSHKDIRTTLYYENPNIFPLSEWEKRRDNLAIVSKSTGTKLVVPVYLPAIYAKNMADVEIKFPLRCSHCYRLRLERTAKEAKELGYDAFSTTLLVSPYQQHDKLVEIAKNVGVEVGVHFYYTDWRPYFSEGQNMARDTGIYRQRYCGCGYSLADSSLK